MWYATAPGANFIDGTYFATLYQPQYSATSVEGLVAGSTSGFSSKTSSSFVFSRTSVARSRSRWSNAPNASGAPLGWRDWMPRVSTTNLPFSPSRSTAIDVSIIVRTASGVGASRRMTITTCGGFGVLRYG